MLHTRSEIGTPRKFSTGTRKLLNGLAEKLRNAKRWEDEGKAARNEVRGTLVDLFTLMDVPGSVAYQMDDAGKASQVLCLDLRVHYEPDMEKLQKVLGNRIAAVTVTEPVFNQKTAEASIRAGIVTEMELAQCMTPKARPAAILRDAGDSMTPKDIKPGEGRVNPLMLAKGLKLDWGERSKGP